jgi:deoxyribonuclease V
VGGAVTDPGLAPVAFVDVHYENGGAVAACAVAQTWSASTSIEERIARVAAVEPYRPGAFYERELPCLVSVLSLVRTPLRAVVVDGYVDLDELGAPGLGARLHAHLGGAVAVVGVAKTSFRGAAFARPVKRGGSRSPLFVTSRGIAPAEAERLVLAMHGPYRLPTLLARVDRLARGLVSPANPPANP